MQDRPRRREVLKLGLAGAAVAGVVGTGILVAGNQFGEAAEEINEVYRGRRIRITAARNVYIDGLPLHVMQNADSSYSSIIDHYRTFASPHDTARAAVESLRGANLVLVSHRGHHQ
ncbi:hypothetical protein F0L68_02760 [Solihabitans fulvus]|uniref:Tyrosinase co-factor MelC1 n=1 Tax=Solihabitans fulvus TaxID=1892852 RepID=A0A5B2XRM2_9PSEU|nr:tyrosinase family oxidase copper chaperone [Solihabitans fulvus]KAA2266056.1 hypothetical protein F0L68_02760 [Solihabitans fulvus]